MASPHRDILRAVDAHEKWRTNCINLIPSENRTSPSVRRLLTCDFGHRYCLPEPVEFVGKRIEEFYRGNRYIIEVFNMAQELARKLFGAPYAWQFTTIPCHYLPLVMRNYQ